MRRKRVAREHHNQQPRSGASSTPFANMQNEAGSKVDLYIPRKCSWTNRLLQAKDHSATQINVGKLDPVTGKFTGESDVYALAGYLRGRGEADEALTCLVNKKDESEL